MKFYPLLINGELVDTGKYKFFPYSTAAILDPLKTVRLQKEAVSGNEELKSEINQAIYAKYCICGEVEINTAVMAAYEASLEYSNFSFSKRVKIINAIYELLVFEKKNLIELLVIEGHPAQLAEWEFSGMEMAYRPESIAFFKEQLRGSYGKYKSEAVGWIRKPDGVIFVSPPGNAPCSNSLTAGFALLSGNTLVVKPPLRMPVSTLHLWHNVIWKSLQAYGAPKGTVNTVVGNSKVIMDACLKSDTVNDVFFFGDSKTGIDIGCRAYLAGKKPILELSGNDFLIVWKDADLAKAADSLMDAFLGSTQICMVPKKAIVHSSVYAEFEMEFLKRVKSIKVGLPTEKGVTLTPVVRIDDFFYFLQDAVEKGAEMLCGGKRINHKGEESPSGIFLQPTVLRVLDWERAVQMMCLQEENFFPLIPIVRVDAGGGIFEDTTIFKTMIEIVNGNKYGLRTSAWAKSPYYIAKFIKKLNRCGLLRINSQHTGFSPYLTTHGGSGLSGGPYGEANYVWQKTTHLQSISVTQ